MPTFRDSLHLGHKVPLVEGDDILRHSIKGCNIAPGAITPDKIAPHSIPVRDVVLPWFEVEEIDGEDWLVAYYADDGAIKDFYTEETEEYIEVGVLLSDGCCD
jgi:hypothetical protein